MSRPVPSGDDHRTRLPSLAALGGYLRGSGWALVDEDSRTSMWRPEHAPADDLFVVLPAREDFKDYGDRVYEALRAVAYVERRTIDEIAADINYGAADTVAVRSRTDVTVEGVVVRLSRDHHYGPGVVVIEGIADDSGAQRRYHVELVERDYKEAFRAHGEGLRVAARGDLANRGSYRWLRPTRSFAIIPGLEDEPL